MKRITLKDYARPDKSSLYIDQRMYSVSLYTGQSATFSSKSEVQAFLAEVNRWLNDYLVEIIELFNSVQAEYWKIWLYLDSSGTQQQETAGKCEYELQCIPNYLSRLVSNYPSYNGGYYTIGGMLKILASLMRVIDHISIVRYDKRDFLEIKRFNLVEERLGKLEYALCHIVDLILAERSKKTDQTA